MSKWIDKILPSIMKTETTAKTRSVPEGIWSKCPKCEAVLYRETLRDNQDVCPKCDHHLRISARRRLELFLDAEGQHESGADIEPTDILKFKDLKKYKPQDWNEIEVTVTNNIAFCTCNGEVLTNALKVPITGPIGFEGDRGQMEYRRVRLKELK